MRVLVVKLTSMGDVLHLMPALSELCDHKKDVTVDWMVEGSFAEIPTWPPSVERVVKVSTRRWRKISRASLGEFLAFWKELREQRYDVVVDAQGLMKSAVFARFAKPAPGGIRAGFSGDSIKESPAARLYSKRVDVERKQHAIDRLRRLFSGVFDYPLPELMGRYDLQIPKSSVDNRGTVMLLHGTTWPTKHLPNKIWRQLAELANADGYHVKICWGNEDEKERAEWIAKGVGDVHVLPRSTLTELAGELKSVSGVIAVDTGLGHLAAALGVACVSVYGATDAKLTGAVGDKQHHLQSSYPCSPCLLKNCSKLTEQVTEPPCYQQMDAASLWQSLYEQIV